jgi:uncharacterized membrane protein
MESHKISAWAKLKSNIRRRLLSGILLLMPFGVTLLVMRWLFQWLAGFLRPIITYIASRVSDHPLIESIPDIYISIFVSVCSIVILLFLLYLVGAVGQFVVGKRLIKAGETLLMRIPLVRTIYTATKQVAQAVSLPDRAAFKSVVLVEFPRPGFWAIGFLTGRIQGPSGELLYKVYIPHAPILTTGFLEIIPTDEVIETDLTIEDGFKMILSGGVVSPDVLNALKPAENKPGPKKD